MRHITSIFAALVGLTTAAGCLTPVSDPGTPSDAEEVVAESQDALKPVSYYVVTRPDFRRCPYPMCGGFFVKKVNADKTKCAGGGQPQDDCYVADFDFSALGLSDAELEKVWSSLSGLQLVVRGDLDEVASDWGTMPVLTASEAWLGQGGNAPKGSFYDVVDNGIVCIAAPCPSYTESEINGHASADIESVDLMTSGAPQASIDAAYGDMADGSVIVAGTHKTFTGPAGTSMTLISSQFYLRAGATVEAEACGSNVCGEGTYCCNESCGTCAPEGGFCSLQVCSSEG